MKRATRIRPIVADESGMTLVEMLVAAMMSVIIVAASCAMLISSVRDQPALSKKAQNVTTARYQLERVVHELRNGVQIETGTSASKVVLLAQVRRTTCGGAPMTDPNAEPIQCQVTYQCSGSSCTRTEAGVTTIAFSGIGDTSVFCFVPSEGEDPTMCGAPKTEGESVVSTYIGVNLQVPNPEGPGLLTISDGATLRTAAFSS